MQNFVVVGLGVHPEQCIKVKHLLLKALFLFKSAITGKQKFS